MYYKISIGFDKIVYGTDWPQTNETIYPCSIDHPLFIKQWRFKKTPLNVITPIPKLKAKAILTDLIGTSSNGSEYALTISNKLKSVLEKYNTGNVEFIPIKMQKGVRDIKGYWMTNILGFDNQECANYNLSTVFLKGKGYNEYIQMKIKDYHHHLEERSKERNIEQEGYWSIYIHKLVLSKSISNNLLIINFIKNGVIGYYVSEKLKKEIEDAGCMGIVFEPVEQA